MADAVAAAVVLDAIYDPWLSVSRMVAGAAETIAAPVVTSVVATTGSPVDTDAGATTGARWTTA
ncbi:hypothetical protein [Nocardia africana]|uniref:Uncharacterized protein n=1 Tax=Nocardia africana TaxID=134964 RepID=A0ABW6NTH3_9NOCA